MKHVVANTANMALTSRVKLGKKCGMCLVCEMPCHLNSLPTALLSIPTEVEWVKTSCFVIGCCICIWPYVKKFYQTLLPKFEISIKICRQV